MPRPQLPIDALPAWSLLNNISYFDVETAATEGQGFGLISSRDLTTTDETFDRTALITIPGDLVLNHEAVVEYAKEDRNFKQLLDVAGCQSARGDILLFLLVQLAHGSSGHNPSVGVSNPWTEYVKFLPDEVPVPTLWTEDERLLLGGTSLEPAVTAKLLALRAEFDFVQEKSSDIPCWNSVFWESGSISFRDWILLDAWYRSRCLELPTRGEAMVPCLDMANHSNNPTAYYEENSGDGVSLLLRPGMRISKGDEITISYGGDKSAAEMLFSYGFLDRTSTKESLTLPLESFPDDPLAKAKLVAFGDQPKIHVAHGDDGGIEWESPFAYLMCVNEEDGLEFRVLQDVEGGRQLRVFWVGDDVTERAKDFETLTRSHDLWALVKLRVVTIVQDCLQTHLQHMQSPMSLDTTSDSEASNVRSECLEAATSLREVETGLLEMAVKQLEDEKNRLALDDHVVAYLGSMEASESDLVDREAPNEGEDDFS